MTDCPINFQTCLQLWANIFFCVGIINNTFGTVLIRVCLYVCVCQSFVVVM